MSKNRTKTIYLFILLACSIIYACKKGKDVPLIADFTYTFADSGRTAPLNIKFTNTSTGALSFKWTFGGGNPSSSTLSVPGTITFDMPGKHTITLEASNGNTTISKSVVIDVDSIVLAAFDTAVLVNSYSPLTVQLTNRSSGATAYLWSFEDADMDSSTLAAPPNVTFTTPGPHIITLKAWNGAVSSTVSKTITVGPALSPSFSILPGFMYGDQAPMVATLGNTSANALSYTWSATGGVISDASAQSPHISFAVAGSYTVTLSASNGKVTKTAQQSITVLPNTNLQTITNVKLGVAAAISATGAFYSTKLGRTYTTADNLDTAGKWIDIAFFGINQSFAYCKFISPDSAESYTLPSIPLPQPTTFINAQELCSCGLSFTAADFDNMTSDAPLLPLNIAAAPGGDDSFDGSVANRIVLFQTADGRKGAIKVKEFVVSGSNSYIVADIKVQKNL